MGCLQRRRRKAVSLYGIGMVLGCNLDLSSHQVFDRVIAAPMAELEFIGAGSVGQGQDLVAQTDPENGKAAEQGADSRDRLRYIRRIPGAVGDQDPVRAQGPDLVSACIPGYDRHMAAQPVQGADNIPLYPAVYGGDMQGFFCLRSCDGIHRGCRGPGNSNAWLICVKRKILNRQSSTPEASRGRL